MVEPWTSCSIFLPLANVFARTCVFTAMVAGSTTSFARRMDTIAEDFKIARPQEGPHRHRRREERRAFGHQGLPTIG